LGSKTVLITCKVPKELVEAIDKLVDEGVFNSRSEAIRYAIGVLLSTSTASGGLFGCWGSRREEVFMEA